jgi:transcriptional regulator with XRE-family HTH domain
MQTVQQLLDEAAEVCKAENDTALARVLGVTPAGISNYRRSVSAPNAVVCEKIAEITGIPLARVLGIVGEARAISREEKAVWRRLANVAAVLVVVAVSTPVEATIRGTLTVAEYMHYAKSCVLAWFLSASMRKSVDRNLQVCVVRSAQQYVKV